jgi:hypothetical protein
MNAKQLIAKGHEYSEMAGTATSNGMALVYLKKARNFYSDGGRDDLAKLIERMIESL